MDLDPSILQQGGTHGLLVLAILYLLNEKKRIETELRRARRQHLSDLRKLPDPPDESEPPPSQ